MAGAATDVMIRLPETFRRAQKCSTANGRLSRQVYLANLSILEMAIKELDRLSTPEIDEAKVCADLNGDNDTEIRVQVIKDRPSRYVGRPRVSRSTRCCIPRAGNSCTRSAMSGP